jgi:hypothetical protein
MAASDADRRRAAELYAEARRLHAEQDYYAAVEPYEESLRLHEDEEVREAYRRLMATIGPL